MDAVLPIHFTPKSLTCLKEGYSARRLLADSVAGVTVAIIALPLAMALGIASIPQNVADDVRQHFPWLNPPAMGLYTAVVAGFIISLLGGSRVQIGGPTAAFIPIVAGIAAEFGYEGLTTATLMAGVIVLLMGLFRFGRFIKFIPYPVTTGFTAGIAVTILASQLKDFFGLSILTPDGKPATIPADFLHKLQVLAAHAHTLNWSATGIGLGSLAVLIILRRFLPRVPGAIVAVILASAVVWVFHLDVETIGTRFGGIPSTLPRPHLPTFSFDLVQKLIPSATTIAMLCAIESLLSAVVADGMTGFRHRSDQELIAQGVANVGSVFFFGLPATGAIARTVANIKSGGSSPLAGMLHAVVLLLCMFFLAPLARAIPLASLAAILVIVAWNISEIDHFRTLLRAPRADVIVLLTTFGLTVFTDLTIAVGVGMVLASMLFMNRMAEVTSIGRLDAGDESEGNELADQKDPGAAGTRTVPAGVEIYEINGPFFFGIADRLKDTLMQFERPPKVFILRLRRVPHIDATGLHALDEFRIKCKRQGIALLLGGVHAQPMFEFVQVGFDQKIGLENIFENLDDALARAREILSTPPAAAGKQLTSEA